MQETASQATAGERSLYLITVALIVAVNATLLLSMLIVNIGDQTIDCV